MADPATMKASATDRLTTSGEPTSGEPASGEPAGRGRLEVADRVVVRIATIAASEVEGVVRTGSGVDQILGRSCPHAQATIAGGRARIHLDIAVAWPHPLSEVTASVRRRVHDQVSDLVGLAVDAVDVTASSVVHVPPREHRRVQ